MPFYQSHYFCHSSLPLYYITSFWVLWTSAIKKPASLEGPHFLSWYVLTHVQSSCELFYIFPCYPCSIELSCATILELSCATTHLFPVCCNCTLSKMWHFHYCWCIQWPCSLYIVSLTLLLCMENTMNLHFHWHVTCLSPPLSTMSILYIICLHCN